MGHSQIAASRFANLLSLAVIVLVLLLMLSTLADTLIPRAYLRSPSVAEFCLGQRIVASDVERVWLQGLWLTAPPIPVVRVTQTGTEYNRRGTLCGLLPWFSGSPGFWYKEIHP